MAIAPLEALNKVFEDRVALTSLRAFPLLRTLNEQGRMKTKTDTNINWDVEVGLGQAAIESVAVDGADTSTGDTVPANLRIGQYRIKHQFSVSRVDLAEVATRAPQDLADLFGTYIDRGLITILRTLNGLLFTGDGTATSGNVIGLGKVVDNTISYAGVNPTTYPTWKALSIDNAGTGRSLTKNLLLSFDEAVKTNETMYNMIVCHPSTATKYNQLFDALGGGAVLAGLYTDANGVKNVELGHGYRTYNGVPIMEDPMCQPGVMYFMYSGDLNLFSYALANNPRPQSQSEWAVASTMAFGLNMNIAELPSNNSARRRFEIYTLPQFQVYNRRSVQVIKDII